MNKIVPYSDFIFETNLSSVTSFLKAQYNNIFKEPTTSLHNLFNEFIKKINVDKNIPALYQKYLRTNQINCQNSINSADSIDGVNKIVLDEIKYFYFSLKSVVDKMQNNEFTIQSIFSRSKDKRLMILMSYDEDKFSNAVDEYFEQAVVTQLKKMSGISKEEIQNTQSESTTERINYDIRKILEVYDVEETNVEDKAKTELLVYKKNAINWINITLFDLLKPKMQILNKMNVDSGNLVNKISNKIKGTTNDNAKNMIINKIINMNNNELKNLANTLGLSEDETGKI